MDGVPDLLVVGAGPAGCVVANRAACELGWSSVVIDRRSHVAGNCYDRLHESGVLIHEYGPHYFRTNSQGLLRYLSEFSPFIPAQYVVKSCVDGRLYPFPVNLTTLEMMYHRTGLTAESGALLLEQERLAFPNPRNSEELVLSRLGPRLYRTFYEGYTLKQWGRHPRDLAPEVCGRIPVRLSREERLVDHRYQVMPSDGYHALFSRMLSHPKIRVLLDTSYADVRGCLKPHRATVYTGTIDEYFGYRYGRLPWRSLTFETEVVQQRWAQPCVQINFPGTAWRFTRRYEIKHVTGQDHPHTVTTTEYPTAQGDPYYPVPCAESSQMHRKYQRLARRETRLRQVFFCGRLAEYRYLDMDQTMEHAQATVDLLRASTFAPGVAAASPADPVGCQP